MQFLDGRLIVSPSDLTGYLECEHLTQQELRAARGEIARPERHDPELDLLTRRGLEHEAKHLAKLRAEGKSIVEFTLPSGGVPALEEAHAQTVAALRQGVDVVYQGTFFSNGWRCHPDFLLRVDASSALGPFSYEVADAKLARKAKAAAVLQACVYAEQLASVQGVPPENIRLILGDGTEEELRLKDYGAYYRTVKRRFEATVGLKAAEDVPPWERPDGSPTYPDPVEHCGICRWLEVCEARRRADDHLCLVAGMRRDQTRRLHLAGIRTVTELGSSRDEPVHGINDAALARLRQQARLQVLQRQTETLPFEVLPPLGEHLGFQALPAPTPADLFFDMEGDPFVGENGLEYLFGVLEFNSAQMIRQPSTRPDSQDTTSGSSGSLAVESQTSLAFGTAGEGVRKHHTFWAHTPD